MTEVPESLRISAWYGTEGRPRLYLTPARQITALPSLITPVYEGVAGTITDWPDPLIRLAFRTSEPEVRGRSFAVLAEIATSLAGHLATADEDWPSEIAMVHSRPLTRDRAEFMITAPDWDDFSEALRLAESLTAELQGSS